MSEGDKEEYVFSGVRTAQEAERIARTNLNAVAERLPHAIESPVMQMAKALVAVSEVKEWYNLTVNEAVGIMIQAADGNLNPASAADEFRKAVRSVGVVPVENYEVKESFFCAMVLRIFSPAK